MQQTTVEIKQRSWPVEMNAWCRNHGTNYIELFNGEWVCDLCLTEMMERCDVCGQQTLNRTYNKNTEQEMCRNCLEEYRTGRWQS